MSVLGKRDSFNYNNDSKQSVKKQRLSHFNPPIDCSISIHHFNGFVCGFNKSFCISNDKFVYSVGNNEKGQLGHKDNNLIIKIPKKIESLSNIQMISCGGSHTVCLDFNGCVYSFGNNDFFQLGVGKLEEEFTCIPQKVNITPCTQIACGYQFTICLSRDKNLYSFGSGEEGELGLGFEKECAETPQLIKDLNDIEMINTTISTVFCKTFNNEFYTWGYIEHSYYDGEPDDNEIYSIPLKCKNIPDNVISIKSGAKHTLFLTSDGTVFGLGDNFGGALGIPDIEVETVDELTKIKPLPKIKRIECNIHSSFFIDTENNLWFCGENEYGDLGLSHSKSIREPTKYTTLSNIIDISSKGDHTFVKTIDNKIYAFGNNTYSQLGIKTSENYQLTPIQVFEGKEDIWCSITNTNKQKSATK